MTSEFKIQGIPPIALERFWPFAVPYIKRALDFTSGEVSLEDMHEMCKNRDIQLWLISKDTSIYGAITTEIVNYPRRKHCRVITLAGNEFAEWVGLADETLIVWAKAQGCNALESFVRKGLVQKMSAHGYKHKHSVLVKELPPSEDSKERTN